MNKSNVNEKEVYKNGIEQILAAYNMEMSEYKIRREVNRVIFVPFSSALNLMAAILAGTKEEDLENLYNLLNEGKDKEVGEAVKSIFTEYHIFDLFKGIEITKLKKVLLYGSLPIEMEGAKKVKGLKDRYLIEVNSSYIEGYRNLIHDYISLILVDYVSRKHLQVLTSKLSSLNGQFSYKKTVKLIKEVLYRTILYLLENYNEKKDGNVTLIFSFENHLTTKDKEAIIKELKKKRLFIL